MVSLDKSIFTPRIKTPNGAISGTLEPWIRSVLYRLFIAMVSHGMGFTIVVAWNSSHRRNGCGCVSHGFLQVRFPRTQTMAVISLDDVIFPPVE